MEKKMKANENKPIKPDGSDLFDRVVSILEQARSNVVRSINNNMVIAYWLIGKEFVQEIQGGTKRATYGKQVIAQLSEQLTVKYGSGFSVANLRNFRQFYEMYPDRLIHYPVGSELDLKKDHYRESSEHTNGFSPLLSWSHYRALMRVGKPEARVFYEREAIASVWGRKNWSVPSFSPFTSSFCIHFTLILHRNYPLAYIINAIIRSRLLNGNRFSGGT